MIGKLLLTLLVILVVVMVMRSRPEGGSEGVPAEGARRPAAPTKAPPWVWKVALVVLLMLLVSTGGILYRNWQENHRVVVVRVINSDTGQALSYRAEKGEVEGRSFRTLDGRVVTVADRERVEVLKPDREGAIQTP